MTAVFHPGGCYTLVPDDVWYEHTYSNLLFVNKSVIKMQLTIIILLLLLLLLLLWCILRMLILRFPSIGNEWMSFLCYELLLEKNEALSWVCIKHLARSNGKINVCISRCVHFLRSTGDFYACRQNPWKEAIRPISTVCSQGGSVLSRPVKKTKFSTLTTFEWKIIRLVDYWNWFISIALFREADQNVSVVINLLF